MLKTVRFSCDAGTRAIELSSADQRILSVALKTGDEDGALLQRVFLGSDRRRPRSCSKIELVSALDDLLAILHRDRDVLFRRYTHTCLGRGGSGGTGGIRLPDDEHFYTLFSDVGKCKLMKVAASESGQGHLVEEIDCRGLKELGTANMGRIAIVGKKIKTNLPETLEGLRSFVAASSDHEIGLS